MTHPLSNFRHCPQCGSTQFEIINEKARHCHACGFTYYGNACAATACFIRNQRGDLLVAQRAKEPAKGTLDLPGGFVDMDEDAESALRRELLEETGLDFNTPLHYLFSLPNLYLYSGMMIHTLDLFFETTVPDDWRPLPADDVAALRFVPIASLDAEQFGLLSIKQAIKRYI